MSTTETLPNETEPALSLAGEWTIARATELRDLLSAHLSQPEPLTLDASEGERFDAATLQVLCVASRAGLTLTLRDPKGVLATEAARHGLQSVVNSLIQKEIP